MTDEQFWKLIDASRRKSKGKPEDQPDHLVGALKKLPEKEILSFRDIFERVHHESCRWDLWGAASVMRGAPSDKEFDHFRAWLISLGEKVYKAALEDPDSLASQVDPDSDDYELEELMYAADVAFREKTGGEIPASKRRRPTEPAGKKWKERDLDDHYPKIAKLVNGDDDEDEDEEADDEDSDEEEKDAYEDSDDDD